MQTFLRVKCKEMSSQNYSKRYEGVIDDDDIHLWPAPLKIAHQTVNSMNEFRVSTQISNHGGQPLTLGGRVVFYYNFKPENINK